MNTTAQLSDSTASTTTTVSAEAPEGKPTKKAKPGKTGKKPARGETARAGKKTKAPRGAKAEKAPRKGRKVAAVEAAPAEPALPPAGEPLPMEEVYANPNQPRKLFDEAALDELAASIKGRGLIQPIKVTPRPQPGGKGKYMIVVGERRWRAHQRLGATTIQATISVMSDDEIADAAIIENLQRKDITPLEEARAYQARLDTGLTVDQLAERLGLKQSWRITERTDLLKLTAENQEAFARGALTPSQAYEMSHLGPAMQRVLFNAIGEGKCRSYAELRKTVQALAAREQQTELPTAAPGVEPPTEADHERVREVEALIGKVCELVQRGFHGNDVVILRKVNPANADVLADKLELIESCLRKLRLELRAAAVTRSLEQTAATPASEPAASDPVPDEAAIEAPAAEPVGETPAEPAAELVVELVVELDAPAPASDEVGQAA